MSNLGFGSRGVVRATTVPTIVVFFATASRDEIALALDEVAEPFRLTDSDPPTWSFPPGDSARVLVRFTSHDALDAAPEHRERIRAEVGSAPSATLVVTLYPRALAESKPAATTLLVHLLTKFYGVADDRRSDDPVWTLDDIRGGKKGTAFLDGY
jgi:hypothetical protein